jgi:hypothetical protein
VVELADKANRNHRGAALGMRITGGVEQLMRPTDHQKR